MKTSELKELFKEQIKGGVSKLYFSIVEGTDTIVCRHPVDELDTLAITLEDCVYIKSDDYRPVFVRKEISNIDILKEREACAKICRDYDENYPGFTNIGRHLAELIMKRSL